MGISDWRAKRHMKHPERGVLRVTGFYDAHSHSRITGVITAPGIPDTPVEHKSDDQGRWAGVKEVPVLIDRADPSKFVILWDEAQPMSWRDQEMQPDRINVAQFGPGTNVTSTVMTVGPDGQPASAPMAEEAAARVQAALGKVFGQAGSGVLGQVISQAVGQAFDQVAGQPGGQPFNRPGGQGFNRPGGQGFNRPGGQPFGQPGGQGFDQAGPQGFAEVDPQAFGQAGGHGFAEVDPQAFSQPGPQGFSQPGGPSAESQQETWATGSGGEQAIAVVVAAQDAAPGGTVDLTLEVTRADRSTYVAATRVTFATPERRAAVATPGTRLRVRLDPNVPANVAIDPAYLY